MLICQLKENRVTITRGIVATILVVAGVLKAHYFAVNPDYSSGESEYRSFAIVVVNLELFIAVWLVGGVLPKAAWRVAIALFFSFALYSLWRIWKGVDNCNCFGEMRLSPWQSFLVDISAIVLLVAAPPNEACDSGTARDKSVCRRSVGVAVAYF